MTCYGSSACAATAAREATGAEGDTGDAFAMGEPLAPYCAGPKVADVYVLLSSPGKVPRGRGYRGVFNCYLLWLLRVEPVRRAVAVGVFAVRLHK